MCHFPLGPADADLVRRAGWKWRLSSPPYPIPGIQGAFSPSVQTSVNICPGAVTLMSSHLSKQTPTCADDSSYLESPADRDGT